MKAFSFSLDPVLRWRKLTLQQEKEKLSRLLRHQQSIQRRLEQLESQRLGAVQSQLPHGSVRGAEFQSLSAYLLYLKKNAATLAAEQVTLAHQVEQHRRKCLEEQRQVELLETLREKRKTVWRREADLELESLAADSYRSRRARESR